MIVAVSNGMKVNYRSLFFLPWLLASAGFLFAQVGDVPKSLPATEIRLNDLSSFRNAASNWKIVGNVFADLRADQVLNFRPGTGVLANISDKKNRSHLFTRFEHGDIEIEMEVMMAKASNSGIYLQGRYELQLFDSWGKKDLKYSYMGGIYQRTDTATNQGYEGSAPLVNACKAPGLWQKLKIIFKAPRFDERGKKTAEARFVKVMLNGMVVQENVHVSGPTRSAAFNDEKPVGPLMIQGNHGKVAFRNIRYKLFEDKVVRLSNLVYSEFKTPGEFMKDVRKLEKTGERKVDSISRHLAVQPDVFLMHYTGRMQFPTAGSYLFKLQTGGGGIFIIDGDTLIRHDGANGFEEVAANIFRTAGARSVPFTLIYNKPIQYRHGLALFVEGPGIDTQPLHAPGSVFSEPPVDPLIIEPGKDRAVVQRSFMTVEGGKKTTCLSVGTPQGIHFTVELATGTLFQVWDGGFLDATPMWHRRGNMQVAEPLGPRIRFADGCGFASSASTQLTFSEYTLDSQGLPEFNYRAGSMSVADKFIPSQNERAIKRRTKIAGNREFKYTLAAGKSIEQLDNGAFLVNDKEYYLIVNSKLQPLIERSDGVTTLVVRASAPDDIEIEYTLLW